MDLKHEYIHQRPNYRFGTRCWWIHIYEGGAGFSSHHPCSEEIGFVRAMTLGNPRQEPITTEEVAVLTGERVQNGR